MREELCRRWDNPENSGRGPQITRIPANRKDFQQKKRGRFFPGYIFPIFIILFAFIGFIRGQNLDPG
jgi:hypothetical protein